MIGLKIKLKFFALYKDIIGSREMEKTIRSGYKVRDLLQDLFKEFPDLKKYRSEVNISVNRNYSSEDMRLKDGDEIAIFPPVSGG